MNLQAPATDPIGWYTFAQWTLNGAAQIGAEVHHVHDDGGTTAVAQYANLT